MGYHRVKKGVAYYTANCTKINDVANEDKNTYLNTELVYNKTPEEEFEEQQKVSLAECYLEGCGIEVKTKYGYYRNTYDILLDFGKYLSKNKK